MAKIDLRNTNVKRTYPVADAMTTWIAGQVVKLLNGEALLTDNKDLVLGFAMDSPDELASPPTGQLLTVLSGGGTIFYIDHSEEVAAGVGDRAYDANVEAASETEYLWVNSDGKLTTTEDDSKRPIAKVLQVPAADNNWTLGVELL